MSSRAITHWLLMEHKTEVDLPFTVGSTAGFLTRLQFLAAQPHRKRDKHACKQVLENHTFSMNYKCTLEFFFSNIWQSVLISLVEGKKDYFHRDRRWTMLCWRQNSFNRNGNVLPLSDHVQFEMHSLGGNLSCSAFLFPPFLSFWLLLITRWDAERGLFRAWQKGNSMNLMSLFDLSGSAHILMHKHTHAHTLESTFISSNPFHGAAGARACPSMYWAEVREIPQTGCEHIRGLMEINRHTLICGYLSFSNASAVFYLLRFHVVALWEEKQESHANFTERHKSASHDSCITSPKLLHHGLSSTWMCLLVCPVSMRGFVVFY